MEKVLSISIVLYCNPLKQIEKALESLRNSRIQYRLFLIDNSPSQSFFRQLNLKEEEIYIFLGKNIGFGSAHNIAIKQSLEQKFKYHLVLNPDVYFDPKVLESAVRYMDEALDVGLLTPKVLYPDGRIQYLCKRLPKPYDLFVRRFGTQALKNKNNFRFEMRDQDYNKTMEVPSLSGCFMFFRNSVLEKLAGFDERFFMYMEDVDISRRAGELAKNIHFAEATIYHEHGQGSYKSVKLLWYHITSVVKYFLKWGV